MKIVAPRVGAWIEIPRGNAKMHGCIVAPRVGAWIEIAINSASHLVGACRTPCGCVD